MKQKYLIVKDDENSNLIIRELAELDKEMFSILCEEIYEKNKIKHAIQKGKEELISALRTHNFYPPGLQAGKIAEAVMTLYSSGSAQPVEVYIDDAEHLTKEPIEILVDEHIETETETEEVEEIFEESFDDNYEGGKAPINNLKSSIAIAEDEFVDNDEEI
ncbi:MAG: hypothetical protein EHM85_18940 [Desulfobacteraceae bacterium]|nr:MAG: hypothetical protein EHM85_18940 [Desulfobacteraceae bacterium]